MAFTRSFLSKQPHWEDTSSLLLALEAVRLIRAVGPKAKEALPQIEALTKYEPRNVLCKALREEAGKTAALLKCQGPASKEKKEARSNDGTEKNRSHAPK